MAHNIIKNLNAMTCLGVCGVLILAQLFQFYFKELPCPLCLLQRVGFIGIAFGLILNAYYQPRPLHYTLSILSAVFTCIVSARQILLHILPHSGSYGSAIFGLHLYVWSFLTSGLLVIMIACILGNDKQFNDTQNTVVNSIFYKYTFYLVIAIALLNSISAFQICGLSECPDNPSHYLW